MQSLFIWIGKQKKFDAKKLMSYLPKIEGVKKVQGISDVSPKMLFDWHFDFENDSTIAKLHKDLETISMQGLGQASLHLACLIQQNEKSPLRIFNDAYDFHFSIKGLSLEDINKRILSSYFDKEAKSLEDIFVEAA